jgi:ssDNA-binding Zn-finger/Zn-ribbon topoisomerase 1
MPIISCPTCSATIIKDDNGKILVGCEHYPVNNIDIPDFLQEIFNQK